MIAEQLWRLTKTNAEWKWGEQEKTAFENLKRAISTKCVGYFRKEWRTVLTVDASPVGLGAVLQQFNPVQPQCCVSRMLNDVERRYSQYEKEALGVVGAVNASGLTFLAELLSSKPTTEQSNLSSQIQDPDHLRVLNGLLRDSANSMTKKTIVQEKQKRLTTFQETRANRPKTSI